MRISFTPQRSDTVLPKLSRKGEKLKIGQLVFDFSVIPDGADLPAAEVDPRYFSGTVSRSDDGELSLTLFLPHGPNPPHEVAFPVPLVDPPDGELAIPGQEIADA